MLVATSAGAGAPPPPGPPPPVLPGLAGSGPIPTPAAVAAALSGPLADPGLGGPTHLTVIDAISGHVLLDRLGSTPAIPASTLKLLTAAAALTILGPQTRLRTRVFVAGADVYLVGGGDPTISTQPAVAGYPTPADLNVLARLVARDHPVIGQVVAAGSQYGGPDEAPGWSPSYLADGEVARVRSLLVDEAKLRPGLGPSIRSLDPLLAAAQSFQVALTAAGAKTGPAMVGAVPKSAKLFASLASPPVSALVERMLNYSDDDVAEGLGRQIAVRLGKPATFDGVASALLTAAKRLGLLAPAHIADASGLSRVNAIAPAMLTKLLRDASQGHPVQLRGLAAALPIAGFSGTLAIRFSGSAAGGVGRVRAKTGWLNGAAGLAGFVTTADGRLLIFAALAPAPIRYAGEHALDQIAATLATCGCR